jgi:hypothetical protein
MTFCGRIFPDNPPPNVIVGSENVAVPVIVSREIMLLVMFMPSPPDRVGPAGPVSP